MYPSFPAISRRGGDNSWGLLATLRGESSTGEWSDDDRHTLVWTSVLPRYQNEIKNGAKLNVRPGPWRFCQRGRGGTFFEQGSYTTRRQPGRFCRRCKVDVRLLNSPFTYEVYLRQHAADHRSPVGHSNPMSATPDFGPISCGAFGTYAIQGGRTQSAESRNSSAHTARRSRRSHRDLALDHMRRFRTMLGESKSPRSIWQAHYEKVRAASQDRVQSA